MNEDYAYRIERLESDVKTLYKKLDAVTLSEVQSVTKLDSMLITLGELKESIETLKRRPVRLWDSLLTAFIGAVCGVIVGGISAYII